MQPGRDAGAPLGDRVPSSHPLQPQPGDAQPPAEEADNPGPPPPRLAFLFLAVDHLPLAEVWGRFLGAAPPNSFSVFVHAKPGVVLGPANADSPVFWGRQLADPVETSYGATSVVEAERRLFEAALADDPLAEWFVLLSESCAPLRTFAFVAAYFAALPRPTASSPQPQPSFLTSQPTRERYCGSFDRALLPPDRWRKGSQWVALGRADAELVARDPRGELAAMLAAPRAFAYDEHAVHTLLALHGRACSGHSLTFLDWAHGGGAHPAHFRMRSEVDGDEAAAEAAGGGGAHRRSDRFVELTEGEAARVVAAAQALRAPRSRPPAAAARPRARHLFVRKVSLPAARSFYAHVLRLAAAEAAAGPREGGGEEEGAGAAGDDEGGGGGSEDVGELDYSALNISVDGQRGCVVT